MNTGFPNYGFYIALAIFLFLPHQQYAQADMKNNSGEYASPGIDPEYHTYLEIYSFLDSMVSLYPEITLLDTSWSSQFQGLKVPVLKISDNPESEEDEPAIGYDGLIHAREPTSAEICIKLITYLLTNYGTDPQVTSWVNNTEIFIIPMLNPDGWKYLTEIASTDPWWSKNQRDNDTNGIFTPDIDGVDLNRNFDYCWENGDSNMSSWRYRGPFPFSEKESQLKRKYALEQKYVMSINYHSYGEFISCSNNYNGISNPELALFYHIADQISQRIPNYNSPGHYFIKYVECDEGYSDCWMYVYNGTLEYTIECAPGPAFIPPGPSAQQIAEDNLPGALYLLERICGPGITGHIYDGDGNPVSATIRILEIQDTFCAPRTSDSLYGRYFRLLNPGEYTIEVSYPGYPDIVETIEVPDDTLAYRDFLLVGLGEHTAISNTIPLRCHPNPCKKTTNLLFLLPTEGYTTIDLYMMNGKRVDRLLEKALGQGEHQIKIDVNDLTTGIYFVRMKAGEWQGATKMVVL